MTPQTKETATSLVGDVAAPEQTALGFEDTTNPCCALCGCEMAAYAGPGTARGWTCPTCDDWWEPGPAEPPGPPWTEDQPFGAWVPMGIRCPACNGTDTIYLHYGGWQWVCQEDDCRHWWETSPTANLDYWPFGDTPAPKWHHYPNYSELIKERKRSRDYYEHH